MPWWSRRSRRASALRRLLSNAFTGHRGMKRRSVRTLDGCSILRLRRARREAGPAPARADPSEPGVPDQAAKLAVQFDSPTASGISESAYASADGACPVRPNALGFHWTVTVYRNLARSVSGQRFRSHVEMRVPNVLKAVYRRDDFWSVSSTVTGVVVVAPDRRDHLRWPWGIADSNLGGAWR